MQGYGIAHWTAPLGGQSTGETADAHQPPAGARDAGISAYRQRRDFGAPTNNQSPPGSNNEGDDSRRNVPDAEDPGVYASYGHYIGGARLASASIPMDGLRIPAANPADWAKVTKLADGALKLGAGQIIVAATLLAAMDAHTERAAVSAAISKFDLDATSAADVLAARAYVWGCRADASTKLLN